MSDLEGWSRKIEDEKEGDDGLSLKNQQISLDLDARVKDDISAIKKDLK